MIVAYFLGGSVSLALFAVAALLVDGGMSKGLHSDAAGVLLSAPLAWGLAYWWLVRVDFPPYPTQPASDAKEV
jgi:hypothetical protein